MSNLTASRTKKLIEVIKDFNSKDHFGVSEHEPKAVKHNSGKIKMSVLFVDLARELEQVAKVLHDGAYEGEKPYGRENWKQGKPEANFFIDAKLRLETALYKGEAIDGSGSPHWAHIIANNLVELWYQNEDGANSAQTESKELEK